MMGGVYTPIYNEENRKVFGSYYNTITKSQSQIPLDLISVRNNTFQDIPRISQISFRESLEFL